MIDAHVFQRSKAWGFLESPAVERNVVAKGLITIGAGPGVSRDEVRERVERVDLTQMWSSDPISDVVTASGSGSSTGAFNVTGAGWNRVMIRVRGVAARIPNKDLIVRQGEHHLQRMGLTMGIIGNTIFQQTKKKYSLRRFSDFASILIEQVQMEANAVILNLYADEDDYSDESFLIDRIIKFSCIAPVTIRPQLGLSWTLFSNPGTFYVGGVGSGFAPINSPLGQSVAGAICRNDEAIDYKNIVDDITPMLGGNAANTVQLQVAVIGWRPETSPSAATYLEIE